MSRPFLRHHCRRSYQKSQLAYINKRALMDVPPWDPVVVGSWWMLQLGCTRPLLGNASAPLRFYYDALSLTAESQPVNLYLKIQHPWGFNCHPSPSVPALFCVIEELSVLVIVFFCSSTLIVVTIASVVLGRLRWLLLLSHCGNVNKADAQCICTIRAGSSHHPTSHSHFPPSLCDS